MIDSSVPMLQNLALVLALAVGLGASIEDLIRRTIHNVFPVVALAGGLGIHCWSAGWWGGLMALLGAAAGVSLFLIFYLLGGMGGGDIKLVGALGAVTGVSHILAFAFWTAVIGGLYSLATLGLHRLGQWAKPAAKRTRVESIPYAPAIACGVWLTMLSAR